VSAAVLRQGPIPQFVHGIIEYLAAVLFIAAPFILIFEDATAEAISIIVGVVILIVAATTAGRTGLIASIPVSAHVVLDYVLAALLIAAPFLFGFSSDDGTATAFFIILGVVHLLLTIATRFVDEEPAARKPA